MFKGLFYRGTKKRNTQIFNSEKMSESIISTKSVRMITIYICELNYIALVGTAYSPSLLPTQMILKNKYFIKFNIWLKIKAQSFVLIVKKKFLL